MRSSSLPAALSAALGIFVIGVVSAQQIAQGSRGLTAEGYMEIQQLMYR
jgi:hypothetical protein